MISTSIRFTVSAQNQHQLRDVLATVLGPTRALTGCITCCLYKATDDSQCWLLLEKWESENALQRHIASPGYQRIIEAMELSSRSPEVIFDSIAETKGLEYVHKIREL